MIPQQVEQSDKARDTAGESNDQKEVRLKKYFEKYMNRIYQHYNRGNVQCVIW